MMGVFRGTLWGLYLATASGELFGDMSGYSGSNFTDLGNVYIPIDQGIKTTSLAANKYEVTNLTLAELPPAYRVLVDDRKRDWQSDVAFSVAGGLVAATGLAAAGPEYPILYARLWFTKDAPSKHKEAVWKRAQTVTLFNKITSYVFVAGLAAGGTHYLCNGQQGTWAHNRLATVFGTAATAKARDDSKPKRGVDNGDELLRAGFLQVWPKDTKQHDELRKRAPDSCKPSQSGNITNYRDDVPNTPSGTTLKVTCKAYTDFGYCDQLEVAKRFMTEMVNRGKTEGTFTVYNRHTSAAHMRCSVGFQPYFFNHHECPFEIPGDQDDTICRGCPLRT